LTFSVDPKDSKCDTDVFLECPFKQRMGLIRCPFRARSCLKIICDFFANASVIKGVTLPDVPRISVLLEDTLAQFPECSGPLGPW
jgi:hypothetical protein